MSQLLHLYQQSIIKRPKLTNALMTGFLFGSGDVMAQTFFPDQIDKSSSSPFDYKRTLRSVIYGSCIFSFIGDKWYKILSKVKFPGLRSVSNPVVKRSGDTIARMAIDQLCWAPVGIPLYYSVMSILERKSIEDTKEKLRENWWPTLKANWMVWPVFQLANFGFVPVNHQLLAVNVVSIAWNTYISMRNSKKSESKPVNFPPVPS